MSSTQGAITVIYSTPWGKPQTQKKIADGITLITTASHGGLKLSAARMVVIEEKFPTFTPWAGACWLEEDCDMTFAVVTWPELWTPKEVAEAVKYMSSAYDGKHMGEMLISCKEAIRIAEEQSK